MKINLCWLVLPVLVYTVLCGCVYEKSDYDIDKIVEELVESSKHHATQPMAVTPKAVKNDSDSLTKETAEVEEVRVSPYGFGPYPEIPADFPIQDIFEQNGPTGANFELMDRVWVELWKRGVRGISGISISHTSGLAYPTIQGVAYVRWRPRLEIFGFGFGKRITGWSGHPKDFGEPLGPGFDEPKMPPGIKVFDMSQGIDPYKLLDLPKKERYRNETSDF